MRLQRSIPFATKMSTARYRNFFRLCDSWPVDASKSGRDLAVLIRKRVAEAFQKGESTQITDPAKCDRDYESLQRLSTDYFKNKYSKGTAERKTGASGLSHDECHAVMSTESIDTMYKEEMGFFAKIKQTFTTDRPQ